MIQKSSQLGLLQQIYGPFLPWGASVAQPDTGELYNTDFTLNIRRRTPQYRPALQPGSGITGLVISTNWRYDA